MLTFYSYSVYYTLVAFGISATKNCQDNMKSYRNSIVHFKEDCFGWDGLWVFFSFHSHHSFIEKKRTLLFRANGAKESNKSASAQTKHKSVEKSKKERNKEKHLIGLKN